MVSQYGIYAIGHPSLQVGAEINMENPRQSDFLKLHFIVFLWGFTAILGKELSLGVAQIVFLRTAIAALSLFFLVRWKKQSLQLPVKSVMQLMLTGLVIAAHWVFFFESARISTVSVCLAGVATTTFWTSLLEPLANRRRIEWLQVYMGLIVILGLYLIFQFEFTHALGLSFALLSAILAATFSVLNGRFTHKYTKYSISFYEMFGAAAGLMFFTPLYRYFLLPDEPLLQIPTLRDWGLILILSLLCTVYAFTVTVDILKRISAFMVNLTINLEPVYGIILALLIYGEAEAMSSGFYWGTLVILSVVLAYPILNKIRHKKVKIKTTGLT